MTISNSKFKKSIRNTPYDNPRRNYDTGNCQHCGMVIERRKGFVILKRGKDFLLCHDCFNKQKEFAVGRKANTNKNILVEFAKRISSKNPPRKKTKFLPRKIKLVFTAMETNRCKH